MAKGAKGLNIFPRAKDPDPLFIFFFFFIHEPFRDPPSISPPSQHRAFCFARLEHEPNVFVSRLLCPPSSILLSSCAPCSPRIFLYTGSTIFTSFQLLAPLFPFSTTGKTWREGRGGKREKKRKKAHARCCQSRRVFFRLSQTPNARLGFRLTDNRRGEDSSSVVRDASRSSIHHISCA